MIKSIVIKILSEKTICEIRRLGAKKWLQFFTAQRILRINSNVPWPCHWSSTIHGVDKIKIKSLLGYPGFQPGQYIQASNGIYIGNNVRLGPGVKLISANHNLYDFEKHDIGKPIIIGDNCWIGANAIILPSVELSNHIIVGAGSVVTKSFKTDNTIIAGVPAKKIREIGKYKGKLPKNTFIINK
ncbi:MAG: acyltransferase [Candidatus Scalindua rubra]|uniref:Galactoside O-acetyltransferase n=1 Tax=Candidatus Scalindua brodae TaxID=237368 RepID=A0A0B0ECD4_9BACT|nr:MAG: galactoside O-acetyltransferase [Candidatus Scalindua brodae]MBZ0108449.1 acyltransferase [Candidatus Scalindua rubra]TWU28809.1 Maltose O-acetyltransferase [Candidatus Brocadiaceae bacterium S225]